MATDNTCSNITYGAYFAQKHALLVVETFFAFPETNGTMEYFLLRSSKYKSFMLTMIILYSKIDLHFSILWIFLLGINPQAEMHWASLRDHPWVWSQAWDSCSACMDLAVLECEEAMHRKEECACV